MKAVIHRSRESHVTYLATHQVDGEWESNEGEKQVEVEDDQPHVLGTNRQPATCQRGKDAVVENGPYSLQGHSSLSPSV